jgi:hypothetical protein
MLPLIAAVRMTSVGYREPKLPEVGQTSAANQSPQVASVSASSAGSLRAEVRHSACPIPELMRSGIPCDHFDYINESMMLGETGGGLERRRRKRGQ